MDELRAAAEKAPLPTQEQSDQCDAAYSIYFANHKGFPPIASEAFRAGWFWRAALSDVAASGGVADGWISVDASLPPLDQPVFGWTTGGSLSVFMRDNGGGDGWLWARQTWAFDISDPNGIEADDDYDVKFWRPMFSAPGAIPHASVPSERQEAAAAGQGEPPPNPVSLIKAAMDGARIPPQYRADLIGHFCNAWIAWQARASLPASPSQGQDAPEANEKLLALADRIDHERLWSRPGFERPDWTQEQHDRCDAGVELRRYASLLGQNCWRIFPPRPGFSFSARTLGKVVDMARNDEARRAAKGDA